MTDARIVEHCLVSSTHGGRPFGLLRRSFVALVILASTTQIAWAQPATSAPPSRSQEPLGEVGTASTVATSGAGSSAPGGLQAPPDCAAATDLLAQRINALAKAVEAKPPRIDPWQDSKAVFLNMLSNRLDAWIFGDGKGSVGVAAQIVAVLAFGIAFIKFLLSVALLKSGKPLSRWERFKAWTRKSGVARGINAVMAALAVIYTGAALYVVVSARSAPDVAGASIKALQEGLKTCQASLAATNAQRQPIAQLPPATTPFLAQEAFDRVSRSCDAASRATNVRIAELQATADAIKSKQPWAFTKLFAFLALLYLIAAITYLVARVYGE